MSLINENTKVAVSSVLNRDTKQYGKKHLFDGNEDTCWNSDQGENQWIKIALSKKQCIAAGIVIKIQFQGGFSCKLCRVKLLSEDNVEIATTDCYPEDINSIQLFHLQFSSYKDAQYKAIIIQFQNSTDFFGRITIYKLDVQSSGG